jgi:quercetin dioxygenase-like cupin family protein
MKSWHLKALQAGVGSALAAAALLVACSDSGSPDLGAQTPARVSAATAPAAHHHTVLEESRLDWQPAPPIFPKGARMVVMQGDPSVAGAIFTVRLKFPDGYVLPAHWHPTDEAVTVLQGTFLVGLGDKFSRKDLLPGLHAGGFIVAPANANHFALARGITIVQVHAMGPFQLTYVDPADDPTR